ncbi:flavodoxin domain-containing protein [Pseudoneobacillus rhizosphaerae]|uniref:Flavodoxin n=1 Tax=Pseudoneobacillus rhizosphaerae TaxID=2880968 RepID=A0A9C7G6G2_9BACI|nr:flavodoxin domain-containing protein [Pseudoneobacillus rhizosphaerae]CAG9606921.1 Flavodoxin [Pseudoneobacillus rhizosphaerae]
MALMNCKLAIVYSSVTGNTEEVASILYTASKQNFTDVSLYPVHNFPMKKLEEFDAIMVGTYTWGNGEIPREMVAVYKAFEHANKKNIVTGVFGTGDSFYPHFCGAVDAFKNMLFVNTTLAATLKIELTPQDGDLKRCFQFVESIARRVSPLMV